MARSVACSILYAVPARGTSCGIDDAGVGVDANVIGKEGGVGDAGAGGDGCSAVNAGAFGNEGAEVDAGARVWLSWAGVSVTKWAEMDLLDDACLF